ncbi:MAG: hypothetical protein JTT11_06620 [Candidatus Brockarchaeota archaeon]|nr:hypothetical protein [Candidatus Brockarchaeota archaeon]
MGQDILVIFWFDTEDFVTPEADDAAKRLAEILEEHGARGVFKLVGEKLRAMERRGRRDVISALAKHEIGYHSEFHSVHPVISEYLKDLDWETGVRECESREGRGVEDIRRIFRANPSCYGQPGGAWAPQIYEALLKWVIPVYLDETSFIGLNDRPFWYCGILNILNLGPNVVSVNFELGTPGFLQEVCGKFKEICERLKREGGGVVSIYNHPCTLVTEEFWDGVNFGKGKNPEKGLVLPRMKPGSLAEAGYEDFSKFVRYVVSFPGVKVVTASEALSAYRDLSDGRPVTRGEFLEILSSLKGRITFYAGSKFALSPAELFYLAVSFLRGFIEKSRVPEELGAKKVLGPSEEFRPGETFEEAEVGWNFFAESCVEVAEFVEKNGRMPSKVSVGGRVFSPESFFSAVADALLRVARENRAPEKVGVKVGALDTAKYVSEEGARDAWRWSIFPEGFEAPSLVRLARLQAWTLKPAIFIGS